jgi:hypothetical protein
LSCLSMSRFLKLVDQILKQVDQFQVKKGMKEEITKSQKIASLLQNLMLCFLYSRIK